MTIPEEARQIFRRPAPPRPLPTASHLTEAERQLLFLRLGVRCRHAVEPDPFTRALYQALFTADSGEFARLESVFPAEATAVRRWRQDPMFAPVHATEGR